MRPISGLRANGCIYTGLSTPAVRRVDFLLSAKRDAAAAERFLAKALGGENHPAPRVINTDKHSGYPPAIVQLKAEGALEENCRHRQEECRRLLGSLQLQRRLGFTPETELTADNPAGLRKGQTLQKISTGVSLISLCLGFSVVGMLIIVNRHQADLNGLSGENSVATAWRISAILVGIAFLVAACLHWNFWTGCSGPRDAEESVPDT